MNIEAITIPFEDRNWRRSGLSSNFVAAPREMIEAVSVLDGFHATIHACRQLGLNLENVPVGLLRAFYMSGLAFADGSEMSEAERIKWRNSVIWPVKPKVGL